MAFEIYKPKSRGEKDSERRVPIVALSKNSIVLLKSAREKLGNIEGLELAFDSESNTIRLKPSNEGQKMKKTKLFAKGFYNHFGINKTGKYFANYAENENALYINLNSPT